MPISKAALASIASISLVSLTACSTSQHAHHADHGGTSATHVSDGAIENSIALTSSEPIEASTATLRVNGMSCPLCAESLDLVLSKQKSISEVELNLGKGTAKLQLAEGVTHPSPKQLSQLVDDAGFTLVGISTN